MTRRRPPSSLVQVIAATLISGGGGVALFDAVMGHLLDEQADHIETLERALEDSHRIADRCDARLERAQEALRAAKCEAPPRG